MIAYRKNVFALDKDLKGKSHIDLTRQKEGGLDVQVFSIFSTGNMVNPFRLANKQIDSLDEVIARNNDRIVKAVNSEQLIKAIKQDKIVAMLHIEGGDMIEDDLTKLDFFI